MGKHLSKKTIEAFVNFELISKEEVEHFRGCEVCEKRYKEMIEKIPNYDEKVIANTEEFLKKYSKDVA